MQFPRPWPSARGLSHALWHGRSVRAQLLLVVVVIELIAGLLAGAVTIIQARTSTRVEIAASMELARLLVSEAVALMQQEVPAEKFLADLSSPLRLIRHVRIGVKDAAGAPLPVRPPAGEANAAQDDLMQLDIDLFPFEPFADRIWELRHNVTSYDAWYVALAEALKLPLATLDEPLSKSNGVTCKFLTPGP